MSDTDYWAQAKADAMAAVEEKPKKSEKPLVPAAPTVGCACPPGGDPKCSWCSMSEDERERLRNAQQK